MTSFQYIPKILRRRRAKKIDKAIPLKEYCEREFITETAALYRIAKHKVEAYKIYGRWYIVVEE